MWLQIAEVITQGNFPINEFVKVLKVLLTVVEKTEEDLSTLIEAPIVAGKGFLLRAEREKSDQDGLIIKAQDEFTKLILLEKKPVLSARASYFVGVCHFLLGKQKIAKSYFVDASKLILKALEDLTPDKSLLAFFLGLPKKVLEEGVLCERTAKRLGQVTGIPHLAIPREARVLPVKDDFIRSLEYITRVIVPIAVNSKPCSLCYPIYYEKTGREYLQAKDRFYKELEMWLFN